MAKKIFSVRGKLRPISIHQLMLRFALFHFAEREADKQMFRRSKEAILFYIKLKIV